MNKIIEHTNKSFKNIYCHIGKGLEIVADIERMYKRQETQNECIGIVSIYAILSSHTKRVYIGSTKNTINARFNTHLSEFKRFSSGRSKHYCSSFEVVRYDDAEIFELDEIVGTREAGYDLERAYIRRHKEICVNIHGA